MKLKQIGIILVLLSMLVSIFTGCQPNSQPLVNYQSVEATRDTIANITLTGSDVDSDPLNFKITTTPTNGTLEVPPDFISSGNLTYIPNPGYIGSDSFTFVVNDGIVDSDSATVSITIILGTFTDDLGRQVDINEIPERIVSFGPSITEILFALGLGEKVVGVSDFSDYPEAATDKPKIGNAFSPSIETVVGLEPDLVLTVEHEQLNKELETLGLTYLVLDPEDIDGILKNIELVGNVTCKGKEAEELKKDMATRIGNVRDKANAASKVSVFIIIDATDPGNPWTAGDGSFINDIIDMVGGINVAATITGDWVQMSIEQIVASDPDIIIIQTFADGTLIVAREVLEAHPAWKEMTAVKEGKFGFINDALVSRPGPRIVDGIEEMAKIIHPEIFE